MPSDATQLIPLLPKYSTALSLVHLILKDLDLLTVKQLIELVTLCCCFQKIWERETHSYVVSPWKGLLHWLNIGGVSVVHWERSVCADGKSMPLPGKFWWAALANSFQKLSCVPACESSTWRWCPKMSVLPGDRWSYEGIMTNGLPINSSLLKTLQRLPLVSEISEGVFKLWHRDLLLDRWNSSQS